MEDFEFKVLNTRKLYTKRRNLIRRFFLVIYVFFFCFIVYWLCFNLPKNDCDIEILNSKFVNKDFLIQLLQKDINNKSIYSVSGRKISSRIYDAIPLVRKVVIRRYLFPRYKYLVVVNEKNIWAKVVSNKNSMYLTDDGDLVPVLCLDLNLLPDSFLLIDSNEGFNLQKKQSLLLRKAFDQLKSINLKIASFSLKKNFVLEINAKDGYLINAGIVDDNLVDRILKLQNLLRVIREKSLMIQYLDLNLESSAILKTYSGSDKPETSSMSGLFAKFMLN